ncbi:MAG: hypothetical protein LC768_05220 [Acidobacteria bacterium]|nr:hypothetical protein [Acidobacteriota bacterium]
MRSTLKKLEPDSKNDRRLTLWFSGLRRNLGNRIAEKRKTLYAELEDNRLRLGRLTDALITDVIDKPAFLERKNNLIAAEVALRESLTNLEIHEQQAIKQYENAFDFMKTAHLTFAYGSYARKRELIQTIAERIMVNKRRVSIKLRESFQVILARKNNTPDGESN